MGTRARLPRRVRIGGSRCCINVVLASQATMQEVAETEDEALLLDGLWLAAYGQPTFGTIYIDQKLPLAQKWKVYWHELIHAINDIAAWDADHPLNT